MMQIVPLDPRGNVVFSEPNRLRHGKLTVNIVEKTPSTELKITSMFWNGDSILVHSG
jgi:hypothetical protein